jgi:hypothetical protein
VSATRTSKNRTCYKSRKNLFTYKEQNYTCHLGKTELPSYQSNLFNNNNNDDDNNNNNNNLTRNNANKSKQV